MRPRAGLARHPPPKIAAGRPKRRSQYVPRFRKCLCGGLLFLASTAPKKGEGDDTHLRHFDGSESAGHSSRASGASCSTSTPRSSGRWHSGHHQSRRRTSRSGTTRPRPSPPGRRANASWGAGPNRLPRTPSRTRPSLPSATTDLPFTIGLMSSIWCNELWAGLARQAPWGTEFDSYATTQIAAVRHHEVPTGSAFSRLAGV
jgi:hypothetical protein